MKQHTLSLTLAALVATAPALAADWAHNDPDKASAGKVEIWDGSKTVTIDSAPTTAVATVNSGSTLGSIVQTPLSLSEYLSANDLNPANWKDITWQSGVNSVSIAGTELSKKTGRTSISTIKGSDFNIKTYIGVGNFPIPAGSEYEFRAGRIQDAYDRNCDTSGRNGNRGKCSLTYNVYFQTLKSVRNGVATVDSSTYASSFNDGPSTLTVKTPGVNKFNSFIKVNNQ